MLTLPWTPDTAGLCFPVVLCLTVSAHDGRTKSKLREIAASYTALQERLQRITSEDPQVVALRQQARKALEAGNFEEAERLLKVAQGRDLEVIEELEKILKTRRLSAAATTSAHDGETESGDIRVKE